MININKELFQDFLDNKIVINCQTKEEAIEFFKYCENCKIEYSNINFYTFEKKKKIILYKELLEKLDTYTGWQILKMIDEGKLKEETIIIWHNGEDIHQEEFVLRNDRCLYSTKYHKEASISYFINTVGQGYFTIEEKEYITFDEARKSGKRFKYKESDNFTDIVGVISYIYTEIDCRNIDYILDNKVWEVEE